MTYLKHLPYGKIVQERLSKGDLPDPFKVTPLFFVTIPELHIFSGDKEGWKRAKYLNNTGYLVLVVPEDDSPEKYKLPTANTFVFLHLSVINNEVSTLLGVIVANGCYGYQIILHSINQNTPTNQIMDFFGKPCQRSQAVIYPEYFNRNKT